MSNPHRTITTPALAIAALAVAVALLLVSTPIGDHNADALVAATMTVNTTDDHVGVHDENTVLSLREAIALANGDLNDDDLSVDECGQVSPSMIIAVNTCAVTGGLGPGAANLIKFSNAFVFPPGAPATINAVGEFLLDTNGTTIDASDAGVIVSRGAGACFSVSGSSNTILGLTIQDCAYGVQISDANGGDANTIGGLGAGQANTIIAQLGVDVNSGTNNVIVGNFLGTDGTNTFPLPDWAVNLQCCGTEVRSNVISGNDLTGITVQGDDNLVEDNMIGMNQAGTQAIPNGGGITVSTASGNTIRGNTIAGNDSAGLVIDGVGGTSENNVVIGNSIGESNASSFPNDGRGILIQDAGPNTIGGTQPDDGNRITNNTGNGIEITAANSIGNQVWGNVIEGNGTDDMFPGSGVIIAAMASGNRIGGVSPAQGNVIKNNDRHGVLIVSCLDNRVRGNSIYDNGVLGINDACSDGVEHTPPTITATGSASGTASFDNDACMTDNCVVDVYSDGADQGQTFHGTAVVQPDGTWSYAGAVIGPNITATMTDLDAGTTTEFSEPFPYTAATSTPTASATPAPIPTGPTPTPSPVGQTPTPTPVGQTPTPTPTPAPTGGTGTPTPVPTPTPPSSSQTQGDNDCDGDSDAVDALVSLQKSAGLHPNQQPGCPELGAALPAGADAKLFGDIDCDGDVDAVDALQILRNVAGLAVNQNAGCPAIGEAW